jgi:hypothetical protein
VEFSGGTIAAPNCDYQVHTTFGAMAPELADGNTVGTAPNPKHIHLGLASDPATTMVIGWRTSDDSTTDAEVLFGVSNLDQSQTAITWQYKDRDGTVLRMFEVHLCGLEPDTPYAYQVRSGSAFSEVHHFHTAPDLELDPDASVVILALGDSRVRPDVLGSLLDTADELFTPDLILFTGDAVQRGADQVQWDAFFEHTESMMRRVPTIPTIGNHEEGDQIFFTLWALPDGEHWFSLDYGPTHITVLDDSPELFPDISGAGEAFLRHDLPAIPADRWSIVMHHQPIVTAESIDGHDPAERLKERWMPLFDQYEVDLVLNGHNHRYERSLPMRGGTVAEKGTVYVVTGAAGAPLYEAPYEDWTAAAYSKPHFVVLRVSKQALEHRSG